MRWLLVLALVLPVQARAEWQAADTALLSSALALTAMDCAQTRYAMRAGGYYEKNPLLGRHPSSGDIDKGCGAAMLGTIGLSWLLPATYRRFFLSGVVVIEAAAVHRHYEMGLRMDF